MLIYFIVLSLNNMALNNVDCNLGQIDFEAVQMKLKELFSPRKREGDMLFTHLKNVSRSASMQ